MPHARPWAGAKEAAAKEAAGGRPSSAPSLTAATSPPAAATRSPRAPLPSSLAELARRPPNHVGLDRSIDCAASSGTYISSGPRSAAAQRRRRAANAAANPARITPESSRPALT